MNKIELDGLVKRLKDGNAKYESAKNGQKKRRTHPGMTKNSVRPCLINYSNIPDAYVVTPASVVFESLQTTWKCEPEIIDRQLALIWLTIGVIAIGGLIGMLISPPACLLSIGFSSLCFGHKVRCTLVGVALVYLGAWMMFEIHPAMYLVAALPAGCVFMAAWGWYRE